MTYDIEKLLTAIGSHWLLILGGCTEIVLAVILIGLIIERKLKEEKAVVQGIEGTFLKAFDTQQEEAWLLIRRKDMMPVCTAGG